MTVLFADVVGSTSMAERLDAEHLRRLMTAYFNSARDIVVRHGGTVEKFIGDAVMAVFGVPRLHEDDALRAVRAAHEIRERARETVSGEGNDPLQVRIGVTTGEVVMGDAREGEAFIAGDTVNTAARLQQAAEAGQILLAPETLRHVRAHVVAEAVDDIAAKGKSRPIEAYRLVTLLTSVDGSTRQVSPAMVGREREMASLRAAWNDAVATRGCRLFTLLGPPGIGKSRLVREFLRSVGDDATVMRGRVLPYGDGVTYWPLRESVQGLAGITDGDGPDVAADKLRAALGGIPDADEIAASVGTAIGISTSRGTEDEIRWAVRRLLEGLAATRPVVVVWDDMQWADPPLLRLVEHIPEWSRDAPLLIVLPARPELLDIRPGWATPKRTATTTSLGPLSGDDADALLDALPGVSQLSPGARRTVLEAAEGNPLFIEELAAMLVEQGGQDDARPEMADSSAVRVPMSLQLLLAARLDRLEFEERALAQRASVVGRVFDVPALRALTPKEEQAGLLEDLSGLLRKELIGPAPSPTRAEEYRFRHALIRDAAYQSLSKDERRRLHESYADYLERAYPDRSPEFAEIVVHHLREAERYRAEVGSRPDRRLRVRLADALVDAARVAFVRDDLAASEHMLRAVLALGADAESAAVRARLGLGDVLLRLARLEEAETMLTEVVAMATDAADPRWAANARIQLLRVHHHLRPESWVEEARRVVPDVIDILTPLGDEFGLARAWTTLATAEQDNPAVASKASARAMLHATRANDRVELGEIARATAARLVREDTPAAVAVEQLRPMAARSDLTKPARAEVLGALALAEAMNHDFERARLHVREAMEIVRALGSPLELADAAAGAAFAHQMMDEPEVAETYLREGLAELDRHNEQQMTHYLAAILAETLALAGRLDEAEQFALRAHESTSGYGFIELTWRAVTALAEAARGSCASARELSEESLQSMIPGLLNRNAMALMTHARVLAMCGATDEAVAALTDARALLVRKGNIALIALVDRDLQALRAGHHGGAHVARP